MIFKNHKSEKYPCPYEGIPGNSSEINQHSTFTIHHLKLILFLSINLFVFKASAQWQPPCQDSTRRNPFFQCNEPYFRPVCGCTNKTYRNECVSYNVYGINVIKSSGVCKDQQFDFDFYPNPAHEQINFALEFFDQGNMTLQIFDTYGKLMFFSHKAYIHRYDDIISVSGLRPGLYIITVISGSKYMAKKLIVK